MLEFLFHGGAKIRGLDVAAVSEKGPVRKENQDHYMADPVHGVFAVADGMGGGQGGREASGIVCSNLAKSVKIKADFLTRLHNAAGAIDESNDEIRAYALKAGYDQMATTVALLAMDAPPSATGVIGHVGDSRIYRFRNGKAERLTRDHTMGEELAEERLAGRPDKGLGALAGYLSHVLTRAVGIEPEVCPDWKKIDIKDGDAFLICSDGVYGMVDDGGLAESFTLASSAETAADIERKVLAAGADDNYTAVVIKVGGEK